MHCALLVLPQERRWGAVKHPDKWQQLLTSFHVEQPLHHGIAGYEVERPNAVNRKDSGAGIQISEGLHNMGHALRPCACPEGVLERCCGCLCSFGDFLLAMIRRKVSSTTIPRTPPYGFGSALILPNLRTSIAWGGTSPRAKMPANSVKACRSPSFSNMENRFSLVIPQGPAAAPRLALHVLGEPLLIQRTATTTLTNGEREREAKTAQQDHPEQVWVNASRET